MRRRVLALGLVAALLSGCSSGSGGDDSPAITVDYDRGFYDPEPGENGSTWRWMGPEGVIRLRNTNDDMVLTIRGAAPEQLARPTISLELNGAPLDQIEGTPSGTLKQYAIPADRQGSGDWSELRISSNKSFVPKDLDANSSDVRRLGFILSGLSWEPATSGP